MNVVTLIGNLTSDPDLRYTPSGAAICKMSIALNRTWKNKDTGELQKQVSYFDIKVWGKQGENCAQYLSKGRLVAVTGRLEQERWEDKETGGNRSKVVIVANDVRFLPGKSDNSSKPNNSENDTDIPF